MHHSTIHTEKSNKMQQCIIIYYSMFIRSSTCFGRHTDHHQEPKTALAAAGFVYVEGCRTCSCWTLSGSTCYLTTLVLWLLDAVQQPHVQQPSKCSCRTLSGCVCYLTTLLLWLLDAVQQPHVQQPSTYAKPEAASAVLGS